MKLIPCFKIAVPQINQHHQLFASTEMLKIPNNYVVSK